MATSSTPRKTTTAAPKNVQPPLMQQVEDTAEEDLRPDFEPEGQEPARAGNPLDQGIVLPANMQHFAAAIGYVEALARMGEADLVMQVARIAYTRGRQTAREQGQDA